MLTEIALPHHRVSDAMLYAWTMRYRTVAILSLHFGYSWIAGAYA